VRRRERQRCWKQGTVAVTPVVTVSSNLRFEPYRAGARGFRVFTSSVRSQLSTVIQPIYIYTHAHMLLLTLIPQGVKHDCEGVSVSCHEAVQRVL